MQVVAGRAKMKKARMDYMLRVSIDAETGEVLACDVTEKAGASWG